MPAYSWVKTLRPSSRRRHSPLSTRTPCSRTYSPAPRPGRSAPASSPDVSRDLEHALELSPLVALGDEVAGDARGEAALRAQREPLDRDKARGLVDPAPDRVGVLELSGLGGEETEHDDGIVADEAQR